MPIVVCSLVVKPVFSCWFICARIIGHSAVMLFSIFWICATKGQICSKLLNSYHRTFLLIQSCIILECFTVCVGARALPNAHTYWNLGTNWYASNSGLWPNLTQTIRGLIVFICNRKRMKNVAFFPVFLKTVAFCPESSITCMVQSLCWYMLMLLRDCFAAKFQRTTKRDLSWSKHSW